MVRGRVGPGWAAHYSPWDVGDVTLVGGLEPFRRFLLPAIPWVCNAVRSYRIEVQNCKKEAKRSLRAAAGGQEPEAVARPPSWRELPPLVITPSAAVFEEVAAAEVAAQQRREVLEATMSAEAAWAEQAARGLMPPPLHRPTARRERADGATGTAAATDDAAGRVAAAAAGAGNGGGGEGGGGNGSGGESARAWAAILLRGAWVTII